MSHSNVSSELESGRSELKSLEEKLKTVLADKSEGIRILQTQNSELRGYIFQFEKLNVPVYYC